MTRPNHFGKTGLSLIETAIVLGVIGLVIGGIWVAAATVTESNRQNTLISNLISITGKLQTNFKGMPWTKRDGTILASITFADYPFGTYIMKAGWSNIIPADMISASSDYPVDPWGQQLQIAIVNQTNNRYVSIDWFNTDRSRCISVANKVVGRTRNMASASFMAAAGITNPTTVLGGGLERIYTYDDAVSACTSNQSLLFVFEF